MSKAKNALIAGGLGAAAMAVAAAYMKWRIDQGKDGEATLGEWVKDVVTPGSEFYLDLAKKNWFMDLLESWEQKMREAGLSKGYEASDDVGTLPHTGKRMREWMILHAKGSMPGHLEQFEIGSVNDGFGYLAINEDESIDRCGRWIMPPNDSARVEVLYAGRDLLKAEGLRGHPALIALVMMATKGYMVNHGLKTIKWSTYGAWPGRGTGAHSRGVAIDVIEDAISEAIIYLGKESGALRGYCNHVNEWHAVKNGETQHTTGCHGDHSDHYHLVIEPAGALPLAHYVPYSFG